MRKKAKIIVSSVLAGVLLLSTLLFFVLFIPTTIINIQKDYAENHYQVTVDKDRYGGGTIGCGEVTCKYCEGKKIEYSSFFYGDYYDNFVYYSTLETIKTIINISKTLIFLFDVAIGISLIIVATRKVKKVSV